MREKEDSAALDRKQREEQRQRQDGKTVKAADHDKEDDMELAARPLPKRSSPAG